MPLPPSPKDTVWLLTFAVLLLCLPSLSQTGFAQEAPDIKAAPAATSHPAPIERSEPIAPAPHNVVPASQAYDPAIFSRLIPPGQLKSMLQADGSTVPTTSSAMASTFPARHHLHGVRQVACHRQNTRQPLPQLNADSADNDLTASLYLQQVNYATNATAYMIDNPGQVTWMATVTAPAPTCSTP
jgi:hypothetical protein